MTADIDIHTVSTADHTDLKLLLAVKPIEEFRNVSNLLCVCVSNLRVWTDAVLLN